jgi:hypothetical protein
LANNPHYKQRFQAMGVPATDAFMCGLFFFCSPVAAVQQYYQKYWDMLSEPGEPQVWVERAKTCSNYSLSTVTVTVTMTYLAGFTATGVCSYLQSDRWSE